MQGIKAKAGGVQVNGNVPDGMTLSCPKSLYIMRRFMSLIYKEFLF